MLAPARGPSLSSGTPSAVGLDDIHQLRSGPAGMLKRPSHLPRPPLRSLQHVHQAAAKVVRGVCSGPGGSADRPLGRPGTGGGDPIRPSRIGSRAGWSPSPREGARRAAVLPQADPEASRVWAPRSGPQVNGVPSSRAVRSGSGTGDRVPGQRPATGFAEWSRAGTPRRGPGRYPPASRRRFGECRVHERRPLRRRDGLLRPRPVQGTQGLGAVEQPLDGVHVALDHQGVVVPTTRERDVLHAELAS